MHGKVPQAPGEGSDYERYTQKGYRYLRWPWKPLENSRNNHTDAGSASPSNLYCGWQ